MVNAVSGLALSRFGNAKLKEQWLLDVVAGCKFCSLAGTEQQAGSDTAGSKTCARDLQDSSWSIHGEKAFITNPGTDISLFTMVMAIDSATDAAKKSFSLFHVPIGTTGYEIGSSYRKMGWRS
ncbi:acyl-CoA dehydrogenase family protein [Bradyrhizobium sp. C-145]|uniref:acyl-CoA dehydrogenase family protein n=1 Tax=Bradyrhizobium sp. C-145 TaxID=574727 RepID=UPI00201B75BA|nr:acyl-CoA dehydrogenase family protein [Bradyrhizobium sp. C-145]UQR68095.1 acyl-CoA dehydrogenase family protein [Bradyrhizobium sp. C-145]